MPLIPYFLGGQNFCAQVVVFSDKTVAKKCWYQPYILYSDDGLGGLPKGWKVNLRTTLADFSSNISAPANRRKISIQFVRLGIKGEARFFYQSAEKFKLLKKIMIKIIV
jgi:hypothetical protein